VKISHAFSGRGWRRQFWRDGDGFWGDWGWRSLRWSVYLSNSLV